LFIQQQDILLYASTNNDIAQATHAATSTDNHKHTKSKLKGWAHVSTNLLN